MVTPLGKTKCEISGTDRKDYVELVAALKIKFNTMARIAEAREKDVMNATDWDQLADAVCSLHHSVDVIMLQAVSDCLLLDLDNRYIRSRLTKVHDDTPGLPACVKMYEDGRIVIRMPHLPGLPAYCESYKLKWVFEGMYGSLHDKIYEKTFELGVDYEDFDKFSISFYHIFPEDFPISLLKEDHVYDYGRFIDMLIRAMWMTKETFHYQLNCTSNRTNQVPEGTYVIIAPDELPARSIDDLAEAYRTGDMPTE